MAQPKRTPCVGICSTTYGDLVCRGCKRFAHEIVQWNGYTGAQQAVIWQRLNQLRDDVVASHLTIVDQARFSSACHQAKCDSVSNLTAAYQVMRHLVGMNMGLVQAGLAAKDPDATALSILKAVDAELYARSIAHYERNFKVPL